MQDKLFQLALLVSYKMDDLLEKLEVNLRKTSKFWVGGCPIHCGNNASALNLYFNENSVRSYWICRTHHCEQVFQNTIIGFVRGVLSNQKLGWRSRGDKIFNFGSTLDYLCKFIGKRLDEIKTDEVEIEKHRWATQCNTFKRPLKVKHTGITREQVRRSLLIPAEFYLKKGYSEEVLNLYDVGLCQRQGKEMSGRVVVPCYDHQWKYLIGCLGRTTSLIEEARGFKWRNSSGFNTGECLFNFWKALPYIKQSKTILLTESCGNVLKLEQAGVHNSVASFTAGLSDAQGILLETMPISNLVLVYDNDEAGRQATQNIINKCQHLYRIYVPAISKKDVGELTTEQVKQQIQIYIDNNIKNY